MVTFLLLAGMVPGSKNCLQVIDEIQAMRSPSSVSGLRFNFTMRLLAGNFLQELNSFSPASSPDPVVPLAAFAAGAAAAPNATGAAGGALPCPAAAASAAACLRRSSRALRRSLRDSDGGSGGPGGASGG